MGQVESAEQPGASAEEGVATAPAGSEQAGGASADEGVREKLNVPASPKAPTTPQKGVVESLTKATPLAKGTASASAKPTLALPSAPPAALAHVMTPARGSATPAAPPGGSSERSPVTPSAQLGGSSERSPVTPSALLGGRRQRPPLTPTAQGRAADSQGRSISKGSQTSPEVQKTKQYEPLSDGQGTPGKAKIRTEPSSPAKSGTLSPVKYSSNFNQVPEGSGVEVGELNEEIISPSVLVQVKAQVTSVREQATAITTVSVAAMAAEIDRLERLLAELAAHWGSVEAENAALKQKSDELQREVAKLQLGHNELDQYMFESDANDEAVITPQIIAPSGPGPAPPQHVYEAEDFQSGRPDNALRRFSLEVNGDELDAPAPLQPAQPAKLSKKDRGRMGASKEDLGHSGAHAPPGRKKSSIFGGRK